jgi:hypothetical protein
MMPENLPILFADQNNHTVNIKSQGNLKSHSEPTSQDSPVMMNYMTLLSLNLQITTENFKRYARALNKCHSVKIEFLQQGHGKSVPTLQKSSSVNEMAIPFTYSICLNLTFVQTWKKSTAYLKEETNNKICQF